MHELIPGVKQAGTGSDAELLGVWLALTCMQMTLNILWYYIVLIF